MVTLIRDYPFTAEREKEFSLKLPIGAKILYCKTRAGQCSVTCEISPKEDRTETRVFLCIGDQQEFNNKGLRYTGSLLTDSLVLYHIYEKMIILGKLKTTAEKE